MPLNHGYYNTYDPAMPRPDWAGYTPHMTQNPPGNEPFGAPVPWQPPVPRRRKRRGGKRPLILFGCLILLLLGLTITIALLDPQLGSLWNGLAPPHASLQLPELTPPPDTPTTVERAPVGDGTTLTIAPSDKMPTLTFQEIYQKNRTSIISVKAEKAGSISLGTGVIMSSDGYIITNAHVIQGCDRVDITLDDNSAHGALLVGYDIENDLAVLKIDVTGLKAAAFGDSDTLRVGDVALAIGNPLGEQFRGTMTDGIISAINRDVVVDGNSQALIQTTAALNSGNSGGALINDRGQVVGITSMKMTSNYDTIEGLGFAIPSKTVKAVADALIDLGHVGGRPTIGITVATLAPELAQKLGVPQGVQVTLVEPKSDAFAQGLQEGDIIISANQQPVTTTASLGEIKSGLGVGGVLSLSIYRDGSYRTIDVKLVEKYTLYD